ncbi:unnamed protein product [Prunus armeniaca]
MRYKFGSAALKHGTETNASDLRLSYMITSVASGKVANNIVIELDPPNMFQLIPTQDTGFHGVVGEQRNIDLENLGSENKAIKEEISKLKVKLEEAQVQAVMYNELCCNAEFIVSDEHKQYDELSNDLQQLLEFIQKEKRETKRMPRYVYDEIKILREPRKAKVDGHGHVVVSTDRNIPCKEAANVSISIVRIDETKGNNN